MRRNWFLLLTFAGALQAQQVVAPTPEQAGPPAGQDSGDYNIMNSFETGYRFAEVGGDYGKYRSDVNYGNGIRLLGSSLSIDSKDGHGRWFDQILLNTLGLGNDPYQSANLRVQKNGWYRYDMLWRLDEFYNPGLAISGGLHQIDTRRRLQDDDLTLFPQSKIRFRAGYSRNTQTGPALTSVQDFTILSNQYPLFTDVRRQWNEYRLGADVELAGFKLTILRRWDFYKDDSPVTGIPGVTASGSLTQFNRSEPFHGSNPGWLGDLITTHKHWAINARMTYTGGRRDFALGEAAFGTSLSGGLSVAANRQILVSGNADRPITAGDFSISLFPTDRLTIVNNTSVNDSRTVGDSAYTEFNNLTGSTATVNFRYLGVRMVANTTDVNFRLTNWLGVYAGYGYSDRLITTIEGFTATPGTSLDDTTYLRNNHMNTETVGVKLRPVKPLTINLEGEIGRDNLPLTPISERNYHTLGGRIDYRTRKLHLMTGYRQVYNVNNPSPFSPYSAHSRNYTSEASWSPKDRFSIDASYTKMHQDTISGLAFFAGLPNPTPQVTPTLYLSNLHAGTLSVRFGLSSRADLFVGYSITRDTGGNPGVTNLTNPAVQALLTSVETFPLSFQAPLARFSIRLGPKLRWNAGYEYYSYREDFGLLGRLQNYRANTGYTSVSWSF